jgi:hypothetical protein
MLANKALSAAPSAVPVYVEDIFSSYLYTGNGSTQTITNNIDLSTKGGLVWVKSRAAASHFLYDTARGINKYLMSNATDAQTTQTDSLTAFNTNGFSIGDALFNDNAVNYVSWTFAKQAKFFDVVTYTGDGTTGRQISHNLGSTPGCIFLKRTDSSNDWQVYHRSFADPVQTVAYLNKTDAANDLGGNVWNVSSTTFTVELSGSNFNANGATYVAYLFAHDAGGFGASGSDNVITCGSFTSDSNGDATVTLGYEPQFILFKKSNATGGWILLDSMRGWANSTSGDPYLAANSSAAEDSSFDFGNPTATGFTLKSLDTTVKDYIYIAIRRGPMKTPTTGTSVFSTGLGSSSATATYTSGFVTDAALALSRPDDGSGYGRNIYSRLQGNFRSIATNTTNSEATATDNTTISFTQNDGIKTNGGGVYNADWVYEQFRRAPGFFDVVCYTGTGSATTVSHNLGVAPELIITKNRASTGFNNWLTCVPSIGMNNILSLNTNGAVDTGWSDPFTTTNPTSSVFSLSSGSQRNASGITYVAYLFASCPGVSKIGTYTGNGSSVTVTTNFQPRFILVKRTDSTGDWIVSDSARGLVAGNDPYLELNTADAEVTNEDWVDISSTSFTVNQTTNNANVNTGTYLYLAIS